MDSINPMPPAIMPLSTFAPLTVAMNKMPSNASAKNSGDAKLSTSGRMIGMASASMKAPMTAPTRELISAAPSARPASPFLAMGWPSRMVAAEMDSPGTPNRMEVMSPVVAVTASIPSRKAKADTGSMPNVNGSINASATTPPRPGRIPTVNPIAVPRSISGSVGQVKTWIRPTASASSIGEDTNPRFARPLSSIPPRAGR